ncbi:MAG TPA: SpoVR family protein [Calditrichia bacterium]|nr:SpoVR family protein [Calditrichia bacterium]
MKSATYSEILDLQPGIEQLARDYGLDFFPVVFEMVDYDTMSQLAAYGGFPVRYPHWRFGMEYDQLSKGYRYGLQKIYEMVINTNPVYAYLMSSNPLVDQKLVMAHVYGHADFFKHNYFFSHTNRKMVDEMANHAIRVRRYIDQVGLETVENFIDVCLSLENLIDYHAPYITREARNGDAPAGDKIKRLRSKSYMEKYINPPEFIEAQRQKIAEAQSDMPQFPSHPQRDVLFFLMENAPLANWQRDILEMIREEAYYFAPQGMTKIMNEGWATYWHSTMMTRHILEPNELIDYAEHHAGTVANHQGRLNPYRLGVMLFKDIEARWNSGRFGKEYEECNNIREKQHWFRDTGLGREKIFEVRKLYNDVTFVDTFMTEEFCREHKMFAFAYNQGSKQYEIESREFQLIKKRLLQSLTNMGQPMIAVVNANYLNRGELLLSHSFETAELDKKYCEDTLSNLFSIWKRPVHIESRLNNAGVLLSFDGEKFEQTKP